MRAEMTKEAEKEKMIRRKHRSGFLVATICAFACSILLLAVSVFAADVSDNLTNLTVESLSVSYSGNASEGSGWQSANGEVTVKGTGKNITALVKSSVHGNIFTSYKESYVTIKLKKEYESDAWLKFDLTVSGDSNSTVTVNGNAKSSGHIEIKLSGGSSAEIKIVSSTKREGHDSGITVGIDNLELEKIEAKFLTTFLPAEHGKYSVDGTYITTATTLPKKSTESYAVSATADTGYRFFGWKNITTGSYMSFNADDSLYFSVDSNAWAVFVPKDSAVFGVGNEVFADLNEADEHAKTQENNRVIVLLQSGTLPADATLSAGNTLLIPYNAAASLNASETPDAVDATFVKPTHFRTLTISDGVTLTVNGNINVNGQVLQLQSIPTGPHGLITLKENGKIILNSGANLYCWGYISGEGKVIANSGAHVYECFQLRGWRGGTVTSGMLENTEKVFPLNQFYIQNIEAELCLMSGATESVYASVTVTGPITKEKYQAQVTDVFIGADKGLFQLKSGSLSKKYIPDEDRMLFTADGEMSISPFSLKLKTPIGNYTLDTERYVLPIHGGFSVCIKSGKTTIPSNQRVALLPGSELTVAQGAELYVNSEMYIYDRDQWAGKGYGYGFGGGYGGKANCDFAPVTYATSRTPRTASSVVDAKADVNGTVYVNGAKGKLYTTKRNSEGETDGANITSSQGDGKIVFNSAPDAAGTTTQTHQYVQGANKPYEPAINCDPAKLRNANDKDGNEQFTLTAGAQAGWTYTYLTEALSANREKYKDMWYLFKVTYIINGVPTVKYITTDSDTFVLDQNIPLTGDKRPVVTTNNATATLDTTSRKIVLSEINGDCIVEFTSETVYKINVSWTGNLNFEYKPNIYRWDAATMCYIREQEAGWRSNEPTVTVTNDRESGSTGNIKADVAFEKKAEFSNSDLGMNFTIGDSTTPNSVTMSDKLIPGKSVTAKMQLTGAPTGLASGANLTIGTVKIILTTVT